MHNNIRRTAVILLGLLVMVFIYVSYLQLIAGPSLAGNPLNRRNWEWEKTIQRGSIEDCHGIPLAVSKKEGDGFVRHYPYGPAFAHITGYDSPSMGKTGIEGTFNGYLSGTRNPERGLGAISHLFTGQVGYNVILTVDANLQQAAYQALGHRKGAIVVLQPKTGQILAMVSTPGYDPSDVDRQWQTISKDSASPLLNRAAQGTYPPGSTFKVMTAAAALNDKVVTADTQFECNGEYRIGSDYVLTEINHQAHGKLNVDQALTKSCNIAFGQIALKMGRNRMAKAFDQFGFSQPIHFELEESPGTPLDFSNLTEGDLAQTGIGQGGIVTSPLHMALLAAMVANHGQMMHPYIVDKVVTNSGVLVQKYSSKVWLTPVGSEVADEVARMMADVVAQGTGTRAQIGKRIVAGKTGTAENPHGASHAWFIGFAPLDNPQVAIAVIVENGGEGGLVAAPIAREVLSEALR